MTAPDCDPFVAGAYAPERTARNAVRPEPPLTWTPSGRRVWSLECAPSGRAWSPPILFALVPCTRHPEAL